MRKEEIQFVKKAWGCEIIITNCPQYCGKLLLLKKGAQSSYHAHLKKQETFYCLDGQVGLTVNGKDHLLNPFSRPKTIEPGEPHSFLGISDAVILEISTHHDDADVERFTESKRALENR